MPQLAPFTPVSAGSYRSAGDFHSSLTACSSTFSPIFVLKIGFKPIGAGCKAVRGYGRAIAFPNQACYSKYVFARIRNSFECLLAAVSSFIKLVFRAVRQR